MTDQQKKWFRYLFYAFLVFLLYIGLVYTYFQFETFSSSNPDPGLTTVVWYVVLNPTGLGSTGNLMSLPSTFVGKLIGIIFMLTGLILMGVFIGKIGDMFNEYREHHRLGHAGTNFTSHMVVIGWNDFTKIVTRELLRSERNVAVITQDRESIDLIYDQFGKESVFVLFSDLTNYEMFDRANVNEASRVLVSPKTDTDTLVTLLNIKDMYPEPDYIVTIKNQELSETFEQGDSDEKLALYAISPYETATGLMASNIFEPDSAEYLNDLISSVPEENDGPEQHEFQQYRIKEGHQFDGKSYGDVFRILDEDLSCPPIGLSKPKDGDPSQRNLIKLPEDDVIVEAGDYVILIASSKYMDDLENYFGLEQGLEV